MDTKESSERGVDLQGDLNYLATHVYLGGFGDFPLFGSKRDGIISVLDSLIEGGVLSTDRGVYVGFSEGGDFSPIDLVDDKNNTLYFVRRSDAEKFRKGLCEFYYERDFRLGRSESY